MSTAGTRTTRISTRVTVPSAPDDDEDTGRTAAAGTDGPLPAGAASAGARGRGGRPARRRGNRWQVGPPPAQPLTAVANPSSSRSLAVWFGLAPSRTTASMVRPSRRAAAIRQAPARLVEPVFMPMAPG